MKIVQSLWSKPGIPNDITQFSDFNKCGWLDKKYNYFSWILSARQFTKFYDEVELVTDKSGYDLLINKLELPYTSTQVVLDDLNDYHPNLWALGKIYAYRIQSKPFIHVDGDVYIWEKFNQTLEGSSLICQNKEEGESYDNFYRQIFFPIALNLNYYPGVLDKSININNSIKAINAGILGGHNINFYKTYTEKAFQFVDKNISHLHKINVSSFNVIFEQFLFRALADEAKQDIHYMHADASVPPYFFEFTGVPSKTKYIHISGRSKVEKYLADCLEYRVKTDYPDDYYRILKLMKKNQI
ncbi:hypothetical protein AY601_2858 [Pedobacter cryoconitis]|uniref:DUF6734 domain-containing protein n=1 Tax=Pedobacter cryoconitis TaxID=188932 RepID=A0A127VEF7_9SPHI|nr:DUF6734 family protein [Pedobacter cryoconitis]AMP99736.1 hypothetical protein AY601_2858 [Pedobacter cryoconitis]